MTVEDIVNKEYKNPSETLINLVEQFSSLEFSRGELIQKIVERAKLENIDPIVVRKMIEDKLRSRGLSDATIRRALPQELKHTQMIREQKPKLEYEYVRKEPESISQLEPVTPPVYKSEPEFIPPIQQEQSPQKPQPDYRFVKYGTVTEAFEQIRFAMSQVMDKTRHCKMGLLIYYQ